MLLALNPHHCPLRNPQDPKKHNMFFSEDTFEPLVSNAGFKEAVKLHHRFMMSSNCHLGVDPGTDGCVMLPAPITQWGKSQLCMPA